MKYRLSETYAVRFTESLVKKQWAPARDGPDGPDDARSPPPQADKRASQLKSQLAYEGGSSGVDAAGGRLPSPSSTLAAVPASSSVGRVPDAKRDAERDAEREAERDEPGGEQQYVVWVQVRKKRKGLAAKRSAVVVDQADWAEFQWAVKNDMQVGS